MSSFVIETLAQPEGWCGGLDGSTRWEDYVMDVMQERLEAIVGFPKVKIYEQDDPHYADEPPTNWRYVEKRLEEEGLAPGKLAEILAEPGNEDPIADIDMEQ